MTKALLQGYKAKRIAREIAAEAEQANRDVKRALVGNFRGDKAVVNDTLEQISTHLDAVSEIAGHLAAGRGMDADAAAERIMKARERK